MQQSRTSNPVKLDCNQNYYDLASIQIVSFGLPAAIYGKQLFDLYGVETAIASIAVGNLILWLIGMSIISMVYEERTNGVENISGYLGKYGGIGFATVLIFSFLAWYVYQINASIEAIQSLFHFNSLTESGIDIRIGAALGLLSATLAVGGIKTLKKLTIAIFPALLIYNLYAIITSANPPTFAGPWGISISGVIATVLLELPGVINLPTFFRHSKSKADSFFALTLMTIFITLFECSTIWMSFSGGLEFLSSKAGQTPGLFTILIPTTLFLVLTTTCSNMLNIYLASACYESFIPRFEGSKGHAIMGLLGTAAYTFIQVSSPVTFLINLSNDYIAIIGVVLLIGVMARLIIRHRPRKYEKVINFATWIFGCAVATYFEIVNPEDSVHSLFCGMSASALFFLGVFFIEETVWAMKRVRI